jgi:hemolysin activation/secretion protein
MENARMGEASGRVYMTAESIYPQRGSVYDHLALTTLRRFAVRLLRPFANGYCLFLTLLAWPVFLSAETQPVPAAQNSNTGAQAPSPSANAKQTPPTSAGQAPSTGSGQGQPERQIYIQEYRVEGTHKLSELEVEEAVYPYLGPGRNTEDVEHARAALEKAYQDKGYQTVSVQIPPQQVRNGVVVLQVIEGKVGRLRIHGSRYFSLEQIRKQAPSMAEGTVPNFNDVTRDIVALNQLPDRRITPSLHAGVEPGTVDIDLNVKDTLPLHGSLELNDRNSPNTTLLRLNGSISYNNFWQLGHSAGFSFQIAPERMSDAQVFSGYYLARFPDLEGFSLLLQGVKQNSNVSTLGSIAVAGRGSIFGVRGIFTLPPGKDFYESISAGFDWKHFGQNVGLSTGKIASPITYYPVSAVYTSTWVPKGSETDLDAGITLGLRGGIGSKDDQFDNSRFKASGNFIYFRGDLSHTHDLPGGMQVYAKVQGQVADQPLINTEQIGGGGLGTVRGYYEAEELGDNGIFGTLELRSPSLLSRMGKKEDEWRIYAFLDAGTLTIRDPLPQQNDVFDLASWGFGSRIQLYQHLNGSLDIGVPMISSQDTTVHEVRFIFRLWADF